MAQGPIQSPIARCDPLATIGPVAAALLRGPPVPYPFFALGEAPTISVGLVPALPCATLRANAGAVRASYRYPPISLCCELRSCGLSVRPPKRLIYRDGALSVHGLRPFCSPAANFRGVNNGSIILL